MPNKRAAREGTLFTRTIKGVTYYVRQIQLPDGTRSKPLYGRTESEAIAKGEALLKEAITTGQKPRSRRGPAVTMGQFLQEWHAARRPPVMAATTWKAQNSKITEHLIPHIGDIAADKFCEDDIRRLQATLLKKPRGTRKPNDGSRPPVLSPTTVRDVRMILHAALASASGPGKRWPRNPDDLKGVSVPKPQRTVRRQLSLDEARHLIRTLGSSREEALFKLLLGTAIRKSEGLGLMWSEVDLDGARVTVTRAQHDVGQELGGIILVDDVKNDTSIRTLALPDFVVVALRRLQMRQNGERDNALNQWHEHGLVFTTQFGTPLGPRNVNRSWYAALKRAGLPHMRLQDVRGSVGSLLLEDGEDISVISDMKGHASILTTRKHYTQVRMLPKRRAADRLQRLLGDDAPDIDAPIVLTPRRARRGKDRGLA